MMKDQQDPYIKAYALSQDKGETFFNLNKDTQSSALIKVLISIAGVRPSDQIFMLTLFFIYFIMRIANEDEIIRQDLKNKRESLTKF